MELQFSTSPFSEYSGLISFRMDWFDLPAVQGTLKSLLQHHSSKASILQCSGFFMVQLSQPYMTTGKIIALTIQTFVNKGMSLLFNTLSRFVIAFLPRSKSFNFMAAVTICSDFEAQENKICQEPLFPLRSLHFSSKSLTISRIVKSISRSPFCMVLGAPKVGSTP